MTNRATLKVTHLDENKPIFVLGDLHNLWRNLFVKLDKFKISNCYIICVGDLEAGFPGSSLEDYKKYNIFFKEMGIEFLSCRGNHENPAFFDGSVDLSNFVLLPDYSVLYHGVEIWQLVGGAISIDRFDPRIRKENVTYWKNEVFVLDESKAMKCDVLVTHTSPNWLGPGLVGPFVEGCMQADPSLRPELIEERSKVDKLLDICKPNKLYAGHFHRSEVNTRNGCRGRILDILEITEHKK